MFYQRVRDGDRVTSAHQHRRLEYEGVTLIEAHSLVKMIKNRIPVHMLSNNSLRYVQCTGHVTIFSTGGRFQPTSNFTEVHVLTLAVCSYAFLWSTIS